MEVEFRLLDGVRAQSNGRRLELGHSRQRCVLAALLVDAGRVVPAERLVARVWDDRPPARVRSVLRSYLSRLRRSLTPAGTAITHRDGGYLLDAPVEAVDVHRFRALAGRARAEGDDERALELVERALALWGPEALAGIDGPWAAGVRQVWEAERATAEAHRVDLALRLGRHAELLAELPARAARHPLDERLAGQLMLALHRAGRSADALAHYRRTRALLVAELGVEPGAELRQRHQDILTGANARSTAHPAGHSAAQPATRPRSRSASRPRPETQLRRQSQPESQLRQQSQLGSRLQAQSQPESQPGLGSLPPHPIPRRLPPAPATFTGRERELAALTAALTGGEHTPIAVLTGGGGLGKSWLALRWAHRHLDRFPDGQLHVDLRGFDPVADPVPPQAAARSFLDALGVAPQSAPADPEAQLALFRDLTADRRLLVVLDNARDTAQVTPLLPGGPRCAVLITSRHRLTGLIAAHGATPVPLDLLPPDQAEALLTAHLGADRVAAEPDAAAALRAHCAGLPLALGILAARARTHPNLPLAALVDELDDASTRLDALDTGELPTTLRAVFTASTRALTPAAAALFALLGHIPGRDVDARAAAALADLPTARTRQALRELQDAHLVDQRTPGRHGMHDLVRLHAAEQAGAEVEAALRRLFDHYCHAASVAAHAFAPAEAHRRPPVPPPVGPEVGFDSYEQARGWLDAERATLLAVAERGAPHHAAHLSRTLFRYLDSTAHFHDALALHTTAVAATGGRDGYALCWQASALSRLGRYDEAHELCRRVAELARSAGDPVLEGIALITLGHGCRRNGHDDRALEKYRSAVAAARRNGHRHSEGIALVNLGTTHREHARYDEARECLARAARIAQEVQDRGLGSVALGCLGSLHHDLGDLERARDLHHRALGLARDGVLYALEVDALNSLGRVVHAADGPAAAVGHFRRALDLARRAGYRSEEARAREGLADALRELERGAPHGS
ncbi:AfsR/SARP family transcriptional regulator [Saccharothrix syringae]|uniref:Tetratricopeptide repeat protein n=1 Tax=Saccharothrix syringae TaxID=103733 RepID=A0A5Q0H5A4_SACSY|nr:BTAD domain-containing putative transcriptional regulator [Saccharothrix syringae]QFZ21418.1 tetratricopeptide repeat protein [Saccharothrix syringae]